MIVREPAESRGWGIRLCHIKKR